MALGPSTMMVFIVFDGSYVNADNTPAIFRWIPRVSLIRWSFQGLCINEFSGLEFDNGNSVRLTHGRAGSGESILRVEQHLLRDSSSTQYPVVLVLYNLHPSVEKKPKFQKIELPPSAGELKTHAKKELLNLDYVKGRNRYLPTGSGRILPAV